VKQRDRRQLTRSQLLRVAEADLAQVVDLGLEGGVPVELVLGGEGEARGIVGGGPAERDAHGELLAHALEHGAGHLGAVLHARVQREVAGAVADGEVALGERRLGRVERALVAEQPAQVADHQRLVEHGPVRVQVHVAGQQELVVLEQRLQHGGLLSVGGGRRESQSGGQSGTFD